MASAVAEVTWLIGLFNELNVSIQMPIKVWSDSKSAIQLAANPVFHERTNHIEIDCHFITDKVKTGLIQTEYVHTHQQVADLTHQQVADLLTKGLSQAQHFHLLGKLGVLNILHPSA